VSRADTDSLRDGSIVLPLERFARFLSACWKFSAGFLFEPAGLPGRGFSRVKNMTVKRSGLALCADATAK